VQLKIKDLLNASKSWANSMPVKHIVIPRPGMQWNPSALDFLVFT
jgi:hypothetical protein